MNYSLYYQADITKELSWLVSATLKYSDHVAFDRALQDYQNKFEFFVAPGLKDVFLDIMHKLEIAGAVSNLKELQNRFASNV